MQLWHWLTEELSFVSEEPDAAVPPEDIPAGSKSDAGWTLDPDG